METIKKVNQDLIETISQVLEIQRKGNVFRMPCFSAEHHGYWN
jgi:hypothetical protein